MLGCDKGQLGGETEVKGQILLVTMRTTHEQNTTIYTVYINTVGSRHTSVLQVCSITMKTQLYSRCIHVSEVHINLGRFHTMNSVPVESTLSREPERHFHELALLGLFHIDVQCTCTMQGKHGLQNISCKNNKPH